MLNITDSAAKQLKMVLEDTGTPGSVIRVFGSSGSCCCGPSIGLGIAEKEEDGDLFVEKDGLKIFIDSSVADNLSEAMIDFSDKEKEFIIHGTASECGC